MISSRIISSSLRRTGLGGWHLSLLNVSALPRRGRPRDIIATRPAHNCSSLFTSFYPFSTTVVTKTTTNDDDNNENMFRLSKLLAHHANNLSISRREGERLIRAGDVTVAGQVVQSPHFLLNWKDAQSSIKVAGKLVLLDKHGTSSDNKTKVWLVHKLHGEVVSDQDPLNRPSMLERLQHGGLGRSKTTKHHLKAIGRLDMSTEGLILVTNSGQFKRELELPSNRIHRTYRARVHGKLTPHKLRQIRNGITIEGFHYQGMRVQMEQVPTQRRLQATNVWLRITCTEGKNRQIRKVFNHLGCK